MFALFNVIAAVIAILLDHVLGLDSAKYGRGPIYMVYFWAIVLPSAAVSVRRLHDTNNSGWWLLLAFIPLLGAIALLVLFVLERTRDENSFGPNPKAAAA